VCQCSLPLLHLIQMSIAWFKLQLVCSLKFTVLILSFDSAMHQFHLMLQHGGIREAHMYYLCSTHYCSLIVINMVIVNENLHESLVVNQMVGFNG